MRSASLWVTASLGVVCLLFALGGINLPKRAGLFPMLVGSLAVVMAVLCLYWQYTGGKGAAEEREKSDPATLLAIALTFLYPLFIFLLGYVAGTIAFTVAMVGSFRRNPRVLIVFAGLILLLWAVFARILHLRLPSGVLWQFLR